MRDRRGPIAAVLAVLTAGAVLAADTYAPPPLTPPEPAVVVASGEPVGGNVVCGVGSGAGDELTLVAARPIGGGSRPAQVDLQRFSEGTLNLETEPSIFPGAAVGTTYTDDEDELTGSWVAWRDAPVTGWREWRLEDHEDLPDATVAGACAAPSSDRWLIPGMSTEGGDEARLRLTNPFPGAATVAIGFLTPEGAAEPLVLRNLTVPARSVREIVVNDTLPEQADLTAVVEVASGRMSVEGVQLSRSAIGGIDGASLLQAAPDVAEEWTVPWVSDGTSSSSWLWIANPGQRTAPVQLTLHTPDGGELPEGLAEVSVPPGEMRRVDLSGTFPDGVRTAAVTARSNGAPVVVSAGTMLTNDEPARTGIAVQLGAMAPDRSWVISGTAAGARNEQLHVVNPTGTDAVVNVALFNGVASQQPAELQDIEVGAGSSVVLELDEVLDERSLWSAFVTTSSGTVVVGRVGRQDGSELDPGSAESDDEDVDGADADEDGEDGADADEDGEDAGGDADEDEDVDGSGGTPGVAPLRLVAAPGIPSAAWSANGAGLASVATEGLVRDLRTATGVGGQDRVVDEDPGPAPDPDPEDDDGA
jgi:hypothetical protein